MADEEMKSFETSEVNRLMFDALMKETKTLIVLWFHAKADYFAARDWSQTYFDVLKNLRKNGRKFFVERILFHQFSLYDSVVKMRDIGAELLVNMEKLLTLLYSKCDDDANLYWTSCVKEIQRCQNSLKTGISEFQESRDYFRNLVLTLEKTTIIL